MTHPQLVLASASPRRRALLARLGLPFDVVPPQVEEDAAHDGARPDRVARRLAVAKARAVAATNPNATVLAADTIVVHRGTLLGKPADAAQAAATLRRLQGRTHRVITAIAVVPPRYRRRLIAHAVTRVRMRDYSDGEIAASIARGDPFDKAGAYAIQDQLLHPVAAYAGCYCNVVGLPLWTAIRLLGRACPEPSRRVEGAGIDITPIVIGNLPPQCAYCPLRLDPPATIPPDHP